MAVSDCGGWRVEIGFSLSVCGLRIAACISEQKRNKEGSGEIHVRN